MGELKIDYIHFSSSLCPYYNLALEEYLFQRFSFSVFLIYRNSTCVVVGKHQNAFSEVNVDYVQRCNIPVLRRISGGGTVFHDEGNLNFSVIRSVQEHENKVDYNLNLKPVLHFMKCMGLLGSLGARNEIICQGKKISGTACHVFKNRTLHHGSFLFDTNLELLHRVAGKQKSQFVSKAVQSVGSEVLNLRPLLKDMSVAEFMHTWEHYLVSYFTNAQLLELSPMDLVAIEKLAEDKYKSWNWNWGYSPAFTYTSVDGEVQFVEKGRVDGKPFTF